MIYAPGQARPTARMCRRLSRASDFTHHYFGKSDLPARIAPRLQTALTAKDLGAVGIPAQLGTAYGLVGAQRVSGSKPWVQIWVHL